MKYNEDEYTVSDKLAKNKQLPELSTKSSPKSSQIALELEYEEKALHILHEHITCLDKKLEHVLRCSNEEHDSSSNAKESVSLVPLAGEIRRHVEMIIHAYKRIEDMLQRIEL